MNMLTTRFSKLLATAAGAAVLSFAPALASAHPHFDDVAVGVVVDPQPCAPVVVDHVDRVWVEPTYRTVCDRVWVAPVVEDRDVHTTVPDRFELRDVEYRDAHRRYFVRENVLVEPAHDVCIRQQVIVTPGHWQDVQRQELVCAGHYEDCVQPVVVDRHDEPRVEARLDFFGAWFHRH